MPENVEELIAKRKDKCDRLYAFLGCMALFACYLIIALLYKHNGEPVLKSFLYALGVMLAIGPVLGIVIFSFIENLSPPQSELEKNFSIYSQHVKAYEYWKKMNSLTYWDSMDGHQFEKAIASLYQKQGYSTIVSKAGGDGGIDIILTHGTERIAVQCKAHSKPVGPAVARDLYGTMISGNFSKAILISKNGFTKGVYDFTLGKPIQLLTLSDVLTISNLIDKSTSEGKVCSNENKDYV
ncbi:MAG: restriction endonuclease [Ruminiclostridium sp.]|nr:restriction endonuclease [Ruminiclostridium sp.]MBQ9933761.1 restriction endonuclease [Ruminiclostridium sp.]